MIRADGYVKVLDFGLAKLTEKNKLKDASLESETKVLVKTNPGVVMGTVSYMSPEQARGRETDERTDIWSLGVVLYEMLSGKVPFAGETLNHTIVAILETDPKLLENVPNALQRIVRKALTKEKRMRYQTALDLLIDLKNLRRELDLQDEIERSIIPNIDTISATENETAVFINKSIEETAASGQGPVTQNATTASSLEYAVTQAKGHKLLSAILGVILVGLITAGGYFAFFAGSDSKAIRSIAVMPFVNESGNKDVEYLADGMTETLINSLSQLSNLNVKARSSVFRYKGKETDPQTIGKELNVEAILNGRITQRGDQLTLSLELINAQTENVLWGNKYERKSSELVSLQTEIARDVSSKLKTKLSGADEQKVKKTYTANPEAFQLYLKGRFYWNKRTGESLKQAVEFYNQAIEKDPTYALAYSGLAETYVLFAAYSVALARDSMPQAKAAALRALAIDDSLAEAHAVLGKFLIFFEFNRAGGEKEYRRAIQLNPNYATAHHWLALDILAAMKRFDEAISEIRQAEKLDPLSSVISTDAAIILIYARRYDEAIAQLKHALVLDPNFSMAHFSRGYAFYGKGLYRDAIAEYRKALALTDDPVVRGYLALSLAKSGQRGEATKLLNQLKLESTQRYVPSYMIAIAYLGLNEKEEAFVWLEKEITERGYWASTSAVAPELDDLRGDPRFAGLLKRLNLPE